VALATLILVLALAAGRVLGGRVADLGQLRVRDGGWLVAALTVQVVGSLVANAQRPAYAAGLVVSALLAARFAARNRHLAGIPLACLGLLLNALVVAANGSMPVSAHAAARAGVPVEQLALPADPRHEAMGPGTRLPLLGGVIPVPLPPRREVASFGDVLLAAGIGLLVFTGMTAGASPGRRTWYHEQDPDESVVV
jgi:hypothetical protein